MSGSWWRGWLLVFLAVLPLAAACDADRTGPGPLDLSIGTVTVPLGDRPFRLHVPRSYSSSRPVPLVVGLHGYTSSAARLESYLRLAEQADKRGFLYALPQGTVDRAGDRFWNATTVCCDAYRTGVDDSGYLGRLIDTVQQSYAVDAARVYLVGQSNGGYMAHRMACDHADQVTAIASLAGVVWKDPARCTPSSPVSVLQIHGTADKTVAYAGAEYPGAEETVARWRSIDGCKDIVDQAAPARDLDRLASGRETTVLAYTDGCAGGTRVELWRMQGVGHLPALTDEFAPAMLDFLLATARR